MRIQGSVLFVTVRDRKGRVRQVSVSILQERWRRKMRAALRWPPKRWSKLAPYWKP